MTPIAHIRQKILKIPQAALANITNTTQATVSRWENGELEPDREQLDAIRKAAMERGIEWNDHWFFESPEHLT